MHKRRDRSKVRDVHGEKNICFYCGSHADSIDHVIPQATIRQLVALQDGQITKDMLRNRALKVWACRECNSLAGCSLQDSLAARKAYVRASLIRKYRHIIELPVWQLADLDELGYCLRNHVENAAKFKEFIIQRISWK